MSAIAFYAAFLGSIPTPGEVLQSVRNAIYIFAVEAFADVRYVIPACLTGVWRQYVCGEISTTTLEVTIEKVSRTGYLHFHKKYPIPKGDTNVVLLCHGDYGHDFTLLHLADIAAEKKIPTFSLFIPTIDNEDEFEHHNQLVEMALDAIERDVSASGGKCAGVLGTGHSKGGMLLVRRGIVDQDKRIQSICALGVRLRVPKPEDCRYESLRTITNANYAGIRAHPEFPLTQIVPEEDWNCSQESMIVRPNDRYYKVPGMHLSGIYTPEAEQAFISFLQG